MIPTRCPVCQYEMDAATEVAGPERTIHAPRPGDVGICLKCGEVLEYQADQSVLSASLKTMLRLSEEQHRLIDMGQKYIRSKRPIA